MFRERLSSKKRGNQIPAVFLWGDEAERYKNIEQRRKILWNLIVSMLVTGMLSKFLFDGLFPRHS